MHLARSISYCLLVFWLLPLWGWAGGPVSRANGRALPDTTTQEFSFLVGGHLYGGGYNQVSVFPSPSLYANLDTINASGADLFIGLGDVVRNSREPLHLPYFQAWTQSLEMPFLNAPGNHDLLDRAEYATYLGPSRQFFVIGNSGFLILDAEAMIYPVDSIDQTDLLNKAVQTLKGRAELTQLFVFSHRLLWAYDRPALQFADRYSNHPWASQPSIPFLDELLPAIQDLSADHQVWWFSGDVGTAWSYPLLYQPDPDYLNLTYIATGMGTGVSDALVKVSIDSTGGVHLEPFPLSGQKVGDIESYNEASVLAQFEEKGTEPPLSFGNRVYLVVHAKPFWLGMSLGIGILAGLWALFAWVRKRKGASK